MVERIPMVPVWKNGQMAKVNAHEVELWTSQGWSREAPKAPKAAAEPPKQDQPKS